VDVLLCPNFEGSEDAPTTAKKGAVKKVRAAASVAIVSAGLERNCGI
jgi:hypothetical protein